MAELRPTTYVDVVPQTAYPYVVRCSICRDFEMKFTALTIAEEEAQEHLDNEHSSPVPSLPVHRMTEDIKIEVPFDDAVNHPQHYNQFDAEVIDIVRHLSFDAGNAVKYLCRAPYKGTELQDLKKALWYVEDEIKRIEGRQ